MRACHQLPEGAANEDAPVAPFEEQNMGSHPTSKARRKRQKLKRKYARLREDAQLADIIETTAEGAVRDERVDPRT